MMKRLLVISDNSELIKFIMLQLKKKEVKVSFCYSKNNKTPPQIEGLNIDPINLKDKADITKIINNFDMIFSLHCKQIFPDSIIDNCKCINFHPGYNPVNKGWYPQVFSILNKQTVGATIHEMTRDIDGGPIISQTKVQIEHGDTSETLYKRILVAEKKLIEDSLDIIIEEKYKTFVNEHEGNYNSVNDFREICKLDMNSVDSLENHILLLRSLTHPPFRNAYYEIDKARYFIEVVIKKEEINDSQ